MFEFFTSSIISSAVEGGGRRVKLISKDKYELEFCI